MIPLTLPACRNIFFGHAQDPALRASGSSGGIGSAILLYLLEHQMIDLAVGAGFNPKDPCRPVITSASTPREILAMSGSKYVWFPVKDYLAVIKQYPGKRIAVVSPPCYIPALRAKLDPDSYLVGFFCGFNVTPQATDRLIRQLGVDPKSVTSINYRGGPPPGGFTITTVGNQTLSLGKEYYEAVDLMDQQPSCHP